MDEKTKKAIIKAYQTSSNSLQDIARIYKVDVNDVLLATGNNNLATVTFAGDLIDQQEAGRGVELARGQEYDVPISLN